jgi:hypothetical protein
LNSGSGYAVGELGLIMQYVDSTYIPVELISFQGEVKNNKVILSWYTASELNNKGFGIERTESENQIWKNIGFVQGNGTTTEEHRYSFSEILDKHGNYYYRLKQIDFNGTFEYSNIIEVKVNSPSQYNLSQNYPNPFNPSTKIAYKLKERGYVKLMVHDIKGELVSVLVNQTQDAGYYEVEFSGKRQDGRGETLGERLASGIYIYRIDIKNNNNIPIFTDMKKMILLK